MMKRVVCTALAGWALSCQAAWAASPQTISHGRFDEVPVYRPAGEVKGFALVLSGQQGWDANANQLANNLVAQGTLVAGIDSRKLITTLERDKCAQADGDLENLSRFVQAFAKLPTYYPPILVGQGQGAALAYAVTAQAPATRFGGLLTLGFCPELALRQPLCTGEGTHFTQTRSQATLTLLPAKKLEHPWIALQAPSSTTGSPACPAPAAQAFVKAVPGAQVSVVPLPARQDDGATPWAGSVQAAFATLSAARPAAVPAPPATVADLPVIEVGAPGKSDTLAILLSGDGGWAGLDRDVAAALSRNGVPTVGVDSLRYFWTKRTPASVTADVDRLIRFYLNRWKKNKVLLIGYSQGADVLPFVVNRLSASTLGHVPVVVMMGLGNKAAFEFQVSNWLTAPANGLPIAPEVARMPAGLGLCVYGVDDKDSSCPSLDPARVRLAKLPGGHHFDGDYDKLTRLILQSAQTPAERTR